MRRLPLALSLFFVLCPALISAQPLATTLTMEQAIALAIQNNLTTKLAKAANEAARGQAIQAAAELLPKIAADVQQSRIFKVNLEAEGFPANSTLFPSLLGPFNTFDARLQLVQTIFSLSAFWTMKAGQAGLRIAALEEDLSREQVAAAAALAYLEAVRTQRAVEAAEADLKLSNSLLKLAQDQHKAGVSTGVDVARAQTDSAQENLRLIRAQVDERQASLRLKRVVGLPLDEAVTLPNTPATAPMELPSVEKALGEAMHDRFELQIAKETALAQTDLLRSTRSQHLPALSAMADYGYSGTTPDNTARTGSIGGRLDLPIFEGGAIHGEVLAQSAAEKEAEERYADTQAQVEEDVRLSLQTLTAEIEEVRTANVAVELAKTELKMAKDRFSAGAGDNIQVLNAQTALARALDDQVNALARYDSARVNLATALGHMQEFK